MSGNEFKEFWELLQSLFPFDFKTEVAMRMWAKHMKDAPYDTAVVAIRRWKKENELTRMNIAPDPEYIAECAKYYRGHGRIFYLALMRNNGIPFNEDEING